MIVVKEFGLEALVAEDSRALPASATMYVMIDGTEDIAAFKKLVQKGSNLEPNMTVAMKELADLVTNGVSYASNYKDQK